MASLRNIMNVDDDHHDSSSVKKDKEPRRSPSHPLESSTSIPSYAPHPDLTSTTLSPSHLQRGSPSSHALPSLTQDHYHSSTSPNFPSSSLTARRRSNTSTDSMDSPYLQGYGHMASSSNVPMRPMLPGAPGADVPVKLTPVTRKVSRAKKGVPVHVCDQCRPPKTFTRAEHLRRHRLSHQPPDRACPVPGCDKVFHRQDLLERHQQRHEQEDKATQSKSNPKICASPTPDYPFVGSAAQAGPAMSLGPGPWQPDQMPGGSGGSSISPSHGYTEHNASLMGSIAVYPPIIGYETPRVTPELTIELPHPRTQTLPITPDHLDVRWHEVPHLPSSASESPYSTSSEELPSTWHTQPSPYPPAVPQEAHSPGMDHVYTIPITYSTSPEAMYYTGNMPLAMPNFGEGSLYNSPSVGISLVRSLSPHLAEVQTSEPLVPTSAPLSTDRLIMPLMCGRQLGEARGLLAAKGGASTNLNSIARNTLPAYIETYWTQAHAACPIIHRPTFENPAETVPEHIELLRCAMASIATQYCDNKEDRIRGDQLHRYAWHKSKLFTQSEEWPLPIMQTVLLCEYYARFRGRKKTSHQPSARFELLFKKLIHARQAYTSLPTDSNGVQQWAIWVNQETVNRLLAACFVLDVHTMCYFQQPPRATSLGLDYASPNTLPIPLSANTEQLWNAKSLQQWQYLNPSYVGTTTVSGAFLQGITRSKIAESPVFDVNILLATHALQIAKPSKQNELNFLGNVSTSGEAESLTDALFGDSPCANTYMALSHTPLHALLSVSGESWILNQKVLDRNLFAAHKKELRVWCDSDQCRKAVIYAARGLRQFVDLPLSTVGGNQVKPVAGKDISLTKRDISDYWGFYICALICWAYSCRDTGSAAPFMHAQNAALRWIRTTADLTAEEQGNLLNAEAAKGVVGLARDLLASDNLGGCNMLLADAVGVLSKLHEGGSPGF